MQVHTASANRSPNGVAPASIPVDLLDGFRFRVCETPADAARALEVRRRVYRESAGYSVPVPDDVDGRSWLLLAEDLRAGRAAGTVRITPRSAGPVESEEYVELPAWMATPRTVEITRLAILPEYRKTSMLVPAVSFGLFRLTYEFAMQVGAEVEIVCAKPERVLGYALMGFQPTGIVAAYAKLNGARHELLWHDFRRADAMVENELFRRLYLGRGFPQVTIPTAVPALGLAVPDATCRLAVA
jgi:hypothetical protein